MRTKICNHCKVEKSEDYFSKRTSKVTGLPLLKPDCKSCDAAKQLAYRSRPEIREMISNKQHEYRKKHRAQYLFLSCKNRARRKGIEFNIEMEDIVIPEFCPILGERISTDNVSNKNQWNPSVDRIDPNKGYIKGNIMVISKKANTMKSNATPEELKRFCEYFINKV